MKLTYDPRHNVAYLQIADRPAELETLRISDELNIDITPDGTVYGIELLNANHQLGADRLGKLIVVNEESGESTEVELPV